MNRTYIPAATIIFLRDKPEFEVLMVERHAEIAFAGGAMVFPGGRIEESDSAQEWRALCNGADDCPEEQFGPRIAAIREAYEETGLLLATRNGEPIGAEAEQYNEQRLTIENDDAQFLKLIGDNNLKLELDGLHLFARWRPPVEAKHKRFDTWFFVAKAPERQHATADGGEAVKLIWSPPAKLLADREAGRRKMIFPTVRNVELLNVSHSAEDVLSFAKERDIRPVTPARMRRDGIDYLTIPADMGYPVTEELLEKALRF
ncbi:NUDIX hydrolase [Hyphococcus sp.]|uniref:NUDIX hydrolase n=1 Tax=Hyphococcus sp. TaxID=2038636 RepID=UPI003CCBAC97